MNILFIPALGGGDSHIIPMYVLYKRYFSKMDTFNCAFLLPKEKYDLFKDKGVKVIDVDYGFSSRTSNSIEMRKQFLENYKVEEKVFKKFYPDLVIEDMDINSMFLCQEFDIPRISVQRTGIFRTSNPQIRNREHCHSGEKDGGEIIGDRLLSFSGFEKAFEDGFLAKLFVNGRFIDVFNANIRLVPGIPSIEQLPPIPDTGTFRFCGPLLAADNPTEKLKNELKCFWNFHKNRKKAVVTTGLVEKRSVGEIMQFLLDRGYAVLTTNSVDSITCKDNRLFHNSLLPLNEVCSNVDLVVHHCGSGMYHYPLLHEKPAITLGTQCYDREEVALRLQELKLSKHVPAMEDDPDYMDHFKAALECFENDTLCDYKKMAEIKEEIINTMLAFDALEAVEFAMEEENV